MAETSFFLCGEQMMPSAVRILIGVAVLWIAGCEKSPDVELPPVSPPKLDVQGASKFIEPSTAPEIASPIFQDVHTEAQVEFVFDTGANGRMFMIESTGGGGGWLDIDRDRNWDLALIQGGDPLAAVPHPEGDRIYQNLGDGHFRDITDNTRRIDTQHGQGLAIGDFNDDGFEDVLVTNVGADVLLENLGDGTFLDVTSQAGVGDPRWGSSAAWGDLDLDGDLDLFVCNYVTYDVHNPVACRSETGVQAICHPEKLEPGESECYENLGDGRFRVVTREWGLVAPQNKALGVVIADLNHDRKLDVFVANDTSANHLFMQQDKGEFRERAVELGCAMNILGQYQANMGVGIGDYDHNGYQDLYITHFTSDSNTLYANLGETGFHDVTRVEDLHKPTLPYLGFGTVMEDLNQDGYEDVFVANGHIDDWRSTGSLYHMPPQLFSFAGRKWVEQSKKAGDYFGGAYLGRAVSVADYDHDGDLDMLVVHQGAPAALLRNDSVRGKWLQIELVGSKSNRRGLGAIIEVTYGSTKFVRHLFSGGSYCSSHQPVATFGLGAGAGEECQVVVRWPHGIWPASQQTVAVNQHLVISEPVEDTSAATN